MLQPWQLLQYPGIGSHSASALSAAVNQVAPEIDQAMTLENRTDPLDGSSSRLIVALTRDRQVRAATDGLPMDQVRRAATEISVLLEQANLATRSASSPWRLRCL
jgi:hypothetical protein